MRLDPITLVLALVIVALIAVAGCATTAERWKEITNGYDSQIGAYWSEKRLCEEAGRCLRVRVVDGEDESHYYHSVCIECPRTAVAP